MTTSTTGFVVFNKTDKTFLCYEQKLRFCSSKIESKTPGDLHLGGGYVVSKNFRPKHILASAPAAKNWAKSANSAISYYKIPIVGVYTCVKVTVDVTF